jgi:hypothetical protein
LQKLLALAGSEHLDHLITFSERSKKYVPTSEFENSTIAHTLVREFGDHLFWDQLISRLSTRDAAQIAGGIEHLNSMSENDRQHLENSIRQRYFQEFTTNGVTNVSVIEHFNPDGAPVKTSD